MHMKKYHHHQPFTSPEILWTVFDSSSNCFTIHSTKKFSLNSINTEFFWWLSFYFLVAFILEKLTLSEDSQDKATLQCCFGNKLSNIFTN